jgi:hypothetical protein
MHDAFSYTRILHHDANTSKSLLPTAVRALHSYCVLYELPASYSIRQYLGCNLSLMEVTNISTLSIMRCSRSVPTATYLEDLRHCSGPGTRLTVCDIASSEETARVFFDCPGSSSHSFVDDILYPSFLISAQASGLGQCLILLQVILHSLRLFPLAYALIMSVVPPGPALAPLHHTLDLLLLLLATPSSSVPPGYFVVFE